MYLAGLLFLSNFTLGDAWLNGNSFPALSKLSSISGCQTRLWETIDGGDIPDPEFTQSYQGPIAPFSKKSEPIGDTKDESNNEEELSADVEISQLLEMVREAAKQIEDKSNALEMVMEAAQQIEDESNALTSTPSSSSLPVPKDTKPKPKRKAANYDIEKNSDGSLSFTYEKDTTSKTEKDSSVLAKKEDPTPTEEKEPTPTTPAEETRYIDAKEEWFGQR